MFKKLLPALAVVALCAVPASAVNQLSNPGFEMPTSTSTSDGNWFRFGSGANGFSEDSTAFPHSGSGNILLGTIGANQFAGVFQKLPVPVAPGDTVSFTGWHRSAQTAPFNATIEIKIEWTGAPQNRMDVLTLGSAYEQFTHTGVAPAGTTGATITYALSSFGPGQDGTMTVHADDFVAEVRSVPEPTSLAALGALALLHRRRK